MIWVENAGPWSQFAWTRTGRTIHITEDGVRTRCGRPAVDLVSADDVVYFGVCFKCRRDREIYARPAAVLR